MPSPAPDHLRHLLARDDEPRGIAALRRAWEALCPTLPFPIEAGQAPRGFQVWDGPPSPHCQVYLYREHDLLGLVIASASGDPTAASAATSPDFFGDALFAVHYTTQDTPLSDIELWERLQETGTPLNPKAKRIFTLNTASRAASEEDVTRLFLRHNGELPPVLEAHLRAVKLARNQEQFENFLPETSAARRRVYEALNALHDAGYLKTEDSVEIPSSALEGVQRAEAMLAWSEAKLRAAALGAELATEALRTLVPVSDKPTVFSRDLASGALLVRQADVEARYNAAARHAADGIKPLAQTAQALSVERQSERRNNLMIFSSSLTGFIVTVLAGIQTFAPDKEAHDPYYPLKVLVPAVLVAALPFLFGNWLLKPKGTQRTKPTANLPAQPVVTGTTKVSTKTEIIAPTSATRVYQEDASQEETQRIGTRR